MRKLIVALILAAAPALAEQQASFVIFPIAGDQSAIVITNGSTASAQFAIVDGPTNATLAYVELPAGASRTYTMPPAPGMVYVWTLCDSCDFRDVRPHGYAYSAKSGTIATLPFLTPPCYFPFSPRSFTFPPIDAEKAVITYGPHGGIGMFDPNGNLLNVIPAEGAWDATIRVHPVPPAAAYVRVSPAWWSPLTVWPSPPRNYSWATATVNGALVVIE